MPEADLFAARMASTPPVRDELASRYRAIRNRTERLCDPLAPEDCVVQSMPDASPTKWHLAHTTWFFEQFVLEATNSDRRPGHTGYAFLFNSYYDAIGERHPRAQRGLLTRPTLEEVFEYRAEVDAAMSRLLKNGVSEEQAAVVEIGLHHEQQHQELLLTDIKHLFSCNPLRPAYSEREEAFRSNGSAPRDGLFRPSPAWIEYSGGIREIGHAGTRFAYDNESPRHEIILRPFRLATRLVTCGEYLAFMEDGGYERPELWLSDGWATRQAEQWRSPSYWEQDDSGNWSLFTLTGMRPLHQREPVCHVGFYEADAFARWAGMRLPTEAEWEVAAVDAPSDGRFLEDDALHPAECAGIDGATEPRQMFGDCWEWTASPYAAYPGFRPAEGALGEYNGKFMCNQMVLRGGSCATSRSHIRPTYRNFFYPTARWQFSGIRLARDA